MDWNARKAANLNVIKRHDAEITDILDSASFVVIYTFDDASQSWAKKGVEGAMFIFKRSSTPTYGFYVMNRLGIENFSMALQDPEDLQITPEYIIVRHTESGNVYGIWVYESEDRERMGKKILECCQAAEGEKQAISTPSQKIDSGPSAFRGQSIDVATLFAAASQTRSFPLKLPSFPNIPNIGGQNAGQNLLAMLQRNQNQEKSSQQQSQQQLQQPALVSHSLQQPQQPQQPTVVSPALQQPHQQRISGQTPLSQGNQVSQINPAIATDAAIHLIAQPTALVAIQSASHGQNNKQEFLNAFVHLLHHDAHFSDVLYSSYNAMLSRHPLQLLPPLPPPPPLPPHMLSVGPPGVPLPVHSGAIASVHSGALVSGLASQLTPG